MKRSIILIWLLGITCLLFAQRVPRPRYSPFVASPEASFRSDPTLFRLDSIVSFLWKEIFSYNAQGHPVRYTRYTYGFGSEQFEPYVQQDMTLDAQGRTKTLLFSYWDKTNKRWNKNNKEENLFGPKGTLDSTYMYAWDGTQWILTKKRLFTYDEKGQEKSNIVYLAINNAWAPSERVQTNFDSLGRPVAILTDIWIDSSKSWKGDIRSMSYYDSQGNEVEFLSAFWNYGTNVWDTSYRETHTHDNYRLSADTRFPDQARWMGYSKYQLRSTTIYSRPGPWVENGMYDLFYSITTDPVVTSIFSPSSNSDALHIYPNPVVDVLQVGNLSPEAKASLLDANGNKVLDVSSEKTDVSHLPAGVYLVRVDNPMGHVVKKVLKR